jgi:heptosyltransferase-2
MGTEKILVVQTAFLGDAILTLPMIQKLNELYSESIIDVVAIPGTKEVFENSPFVNEVYAFDKRGTQKTILQLLNFASLLKKNNYTKLFSPHRSLRTSLLVLLLNINESFGFDTSSFSYVYKRRIKYYKEHHEVARNLELIGADTTGDNWKVLPGISISNSVTAKVSELIYKIGKPLIAIAPGSVWETKKYPQEYYSKLGEYFINKKYNVIYVGGENDFLLCDQFQAPNNSINLAGKLSVTETIALLKHCSLLISNDSAPTHMGMAADIPVLTLYCSTVPDFGFYPYNNKSAYLSYDDLECKPCGIHGRKSCPIKTFDCGLNLHPQKVIEKIEQILK